jgi:hypothetical protein
MGGVWDLEIEKEKMKSEDFRMRWGCEGKG